MADSATRGAPAGPGAHSGYVAFDLEANADRADPPAHEIIEIGAVAVLDGREVSRFETLVRPTRPLRETTRQLTGLDDAALAGAASPAAALESFCEFAAGRPLVAHNGFGYDYPLLDATAERTGVRLPAVTRLDSLELAHLVYPRAAKSAGTDIDGRRPPKGHSLDALAKFLLGARPRTTHRALGDALLLREVLTRLLAEMGRDEPVRRLQRWALGATGHPWASLLAEVSNPPPLEHVIPAPAPPPVRPPARGARTFDPVAVGAAFERGGRLMSKAREPREAQIQMAKAVAETLRDGGRRLIEAPTGTGKTLAYLAPAIEYAIAAGETVMIAPHSKVLQDQIMTTLEELQGEIGPFVSAVVKGAANYISLEALAGELDALAAALPQESSKGVESADRPLAGSAGAGSPHESAGATDNPESAETPAFEPGPPHPPAPATDADDHALGLMLAIICGWVAKTPTGDWDDLRSGSIESNRSVAPLGSGLWTLDPNGPATTTSGSSAPARPSVNPNRAARRALQARLRTTGEADSWAGDLARLDFLTRARDMVCPTRDGPAPAHVVVGNHALIVTWDGWQDGAERLILDEAHNFEDAATDALTSEAGVSDVEELARLVWNGRGRSTVRRLAEAAGWRLAEEPLSSLRETAEQVIETTSALTAPLVGYVRGRTAASPSDTYPASLRIQPGGDTGHRDYSPVVTSGRNLVAALRQLRAAFNEVNLPGELKPPYKRRRLEDEIARMGQEAKRLADVIDRALWAEDPTRMVSACEIAHSNGAWTWTLKQMPLSVASKLRDIWDSLSALVGTSATLAVGGDFGHIMNSLGLEATNPPLRLASPFPWLSENHLLLRTDYLPAPRARLMEEFKGSAAREIPRLLILTGGRGLVLMTARARLEFVRDHARPILEATEAPDGPKAEGIPLLAQGDDSAAALVERMRTERAASLLALRSFWEGVDVPGEALSLLIIEKIPFDSPADPLTAARMSDYRDAGREPFRDYLVPRAALRFAQGVGRLIRTESDRGVTVVLDSRLCRPTPYRETMLKTLPGPPSRHTARSGDEAYRAVAAHLGDVSYDDAMRARLEAVPGAGAWSDLASLALTDAEAADAALVAERLDEVRRRFGFDRWRPGQLEVMQRFIAGRDTLAVLPTGSGKSITFQIPALLSPGLTLVVSPLTALMNDQVQNLRSRGVTQVQTIHSGVGQSEWRDILRAARKGHYKLIYVSPERLWSQEFVRTLADLDVRRVAIDEAHCISQWGHTFRPEYKAIPKALEWITAGRLPTLAVTATATPKVRSEIRDLLRLQADPADDIARSPDRPEIRYYIERCSDRADRDLRAVQIVESLRRRAAIVYVPTRRDTTRLAATLAVAGHVAQPYHGGMEQPRRQYIEDAFRHGEVDVVVATKAFGMGIDKPDIELVVHLEMPPTIEEYVQETGRLVRGAIDGHEPAIGHAVLLSTPRDCSIHRHVIRNAAPDRDEVQRVWERLRPGSKAYDPDELLEGDPELAGADRERVTLALALHYLADDGCVRRGLDTPWRGRVTLPGFESAGHASAPNSGADDGDSERSVAGHPAARRTDAAYPAAGGRAAADGGSRHDVAGLSPEARRILAYVEERIAASDAEGASITYEAETWSGDLHMTPQVLAGELFELSRRDILGFAAWRYAWTLERHPDRQPNWQAVSEQAEQRREVVTEQSDRAKAYASLTAKRTQPPNRTRSASPPPSARCRRQVLLDHLEGAGRRDPGEAQNCGACDGCVALARPWADSPLDRSSLIEALGAEAVILRLVADNSKLSKPFSRRNLVRTLAGTAGTGERALRRWLADHPSFGRLRLLDEDGVNERVDAAVESGYCKAEQAEGPSGTHYVYLEITAAGRDALGAR